MSYVYIIETDKQEWQNLWKSRAGPTSDSLTAQKPPGPFKYTD